MANSNQNVFKKFVSNQRFSDSVEQNKNKSFSLRILIILISVFLSHAILKIYCRLLTAG